MRSIKLPSWIENALGLESQPVPPFAFSIDARCVRFACFERAGDALRSIASGTHYWPEPVFQSGPLGGPLIPESEISKGLETVLAVAPTPVKEAVLVLPDQWLRTAYAELNELPNSARAREEVLRWKLGQLVPFRVEELRLRGTEVPALRGADATRRVLLGFGVEQLLEELESAFKDVGIRIGWITNETLATVAGPVVSEAVAREQLLAALLVRRDGYSLSVLDGSTPVLLRFKPVNRAVDLASLRTMARRELVLTADFVRERFVDRGLGGVFVLADHDAEDWRDLAAEALDAPAEVSRTPVSGAWQLESDLDWTDFAPLVGAVSLSTV